MKNFNPFVEASTKDDYNQNYYKSNSATMTRFWISFKWSSCYACLTHLPCPPIKSEKMNKLGLGLRFVPKWMIGCFCNENWSAFSQHWIALKCYYWMFLLWSCQKLQLNLGSIWLNSRWWIPTSYWPRLRTICMELAHCRSLAWLCNIVWNIILSRTKKLRTSQT